MTTRTQPDTLTFKTSPTLTALSLLALSAPQHAGLPGTGALARTVREASGRLNLRPREADLLAAALRDYAEDRLREGSEDHREARDFAHALEDAASTVDGLVARAVDELRETVAEDAARAAGADRAARERANELRDEMLRQVFTGGPRKTLNIWGQVVDDPEPSEERITEDFVDALGEVVDHNRRMKIEGATQLLAGNTKTGRPG